MSDVEPIGSGRLAGHAEAFCAVYCQRPDGSCPLGPRRDDCPLWRFVRADLPIHVSVHLPSAVARVCPTLDPEQREAVKKAIEVSRSAFDPEDGYDWPS